MTNQWIEYVKLFKKFSLSIEENFTKPDTVVFKYNNNTFEIIDFEIIH